MGFSTRPVPAKTFYPEQMYKIIASALYPDVAPRAPAMPTQVATVQEDHREKKQSLKRVSALSGVVSLASTVEHLAWDVPQIAACRNVGLPEALQAKQRRRQMV